MKEQTGQLWKEFGKMPFPRVPEVTNTELPLAETYASGGIASYVEEGKISSYQREHLIGSKEVIEEKLESLTGESKIYFGKLLLLINLTLESTQ